VGGVIIVALTIFLLEFLYYTFLWKLWNNQFTFGGLGGSGTFSISKNNIVESPYYTLNANKISGEKYNIFPVLQSFLVIFFYVQQNKISLFIRSRISLTEIIHKTTKKW